MRICHINEPAAGGSFGVVVALVEHALRNGHEVHVIYSPERHDPAMVRQLQASGAGVHTSPMRRSVGVWDAKDGLRLRQLLRSLGRFDTIHSHSSKAGALARVFGQRAGTAQIYSPHGFYTMTGAAPSYVGRVEQALSLVSSRIIAVSAYERDHAIALGISPARITVVPNGLRPSPVLSRDEARAQLGLNSKAFIIGFVGRLEAQKDPLAAIGVMAELAGNEIELAMIGNGALRHAAEREAAQTSAKVHFLGSREAKPLFAAFDVLLCTSRYEGMPIAFLESLNAGVPIISFPVGGADELIDEGRTGMVVEPRPECAAQAVRRLQAASHEVRQEMREACLRKAAEHTDETMGSATLDVYREVLAGR